MLNDLSRWIASCQCVPGAARRPPDSKIGFAVAIIVPGNGNIFSGDPTAERLGYQGCLGMTYQLPLAGPPYGVVNSSVTVKICKYRNFARQAPLLNDRGIRVG